MKSCVDRYTSLALSGEDGQQVKDASLWLIMYYQLSNRKTFYQCLWTRNPQ